MVQWENLGGFPSIAGWFHGQSIWFHGWELGVLRGAPKNLMETSTAIFLIWVLEGTLGKTMAVPCCPGWTLGTLGIRESNTRKYVCMYCMIYVYIDIYIYICVCVCVSIYIYIIYSYSIYIFILRMYIIYIYIKKETYCMYKCTNVIKCVHIKSHAQTIYVCQSQHLWMVSCKPVYKPSHE